MRYWAYLAGKVVVAAAPLYGLLKLVLKTFPKPPQGADSDWSRLHSLGPELLAYVYVMVWFLLCAGALYAIVWDQRRRCRVCLRRLRMPIETGSRGFMLQFGQPRIETICVYGHGTLSEDEARSMTDAEWTPHPDDIWETLCAPSKDTGQEP